MYLRRRGLTAIEFLVPVGLVTALGVALVAASATARVKSPSAGTRARLMAIQAALEMYRGDHGRYPAGSPRPDDDDAPWLCAALLFAPEAGGGANGPYLHHWRDVGLLDASGVGAPIARPLTEREAAALRDPAFQRAHGPETARPLVLLDPWGRPLHGRSWATLRPAERERLVHEPWLRGPFDLLPGEPGTRAPIAHTVEDRPHREVGWDLWSSGPNGVNEYGSACSDDVSSWSADHEPLCTCAPAWLPGAPSGGLGMLALSGVLGLVVGQKLARRRAPRRAPREPPRVDVHARSAIARCAYCHAVDRRTPVLACTGCGAGLHLDCWHDAGGCPTLGCA